MLLSRISSALPQRRIWVCALVLIGLGAILGIVGERLHWFGLFRRRLTVGDCTSVNIYAPYFAWGLKVLPDGSAVLSPGAEFDPEKVGFNIWGTQGYNDYPTSKCSFPPGSFDYPTLCRDLLGQRDTEFKEVAPLDYPDMPSNVMFGVTDEWQQAMMKRVLQENAPWEFALGTLPSGAGQGLIESARMKAIEGRFWPGDWDDIWPYPPIPWGFSSGNTPPVPPKLRVQRPLNFDRTWAAVVPDEELRNIAPRGFGTGVHMGLIEDDVTWERVWSAWRGKEQRPRIDFREEFVVVATTYTIHIHLKPPKLRMGPQGKLHIPDPPGTTDGNEPGFGYLLGVLHRKGIKSVNGHSLSDNGANDAHSR